MHFVLRNLKYCWLENKLCFARDQPNEMDRFSCLGICILHSGRIPEELSLGIQKTRFVSVISKHPVIGWMSIVWLIVTPVLVYGSETRPLEAVDLRRILVFDHRYIHSIGMIWWKNFMNCSEVRQRLLRSSGPVVRIGTKSEWAKVIGTCFVRVHGTTAPLHAVFRGRWLFGNLSRWLVSEMRRSEK